MRNAHAFPAAFSPASSQYLLCRGLCLMDLCLRQAGKLERHVKSEDAPASNDGPVKVVTANTFDALTKGQNVLLEFYAPWCWPKPARAGR